MRRLISAHFLQILVEGVWESGGEEVGVGVVCKSGAVKGVFKVLEGEGVVEDVGFVGREGMVKS